jgi:RNA polymerase sigma-70 factor (ECF subfamily)
MSKPMSDRPGNDPTARSLRPIGRETGIPDELAADAQVIEYYRNLHFRGREWEEFLSGMHSFGIARINALLASGAIFAKASKLTKRNIYQDQHRIQDCDRAELVSDSVHAALLSFIAKGIVRGGWSPHGGASLRTYFANACVLSFTDVYKSWRKAQLTNLPEVAFEHLDQVEARVVAATYRDETGLDLLNDALDRMSKEEIDIFTRIVQGYTQEEIALKLGRTERAVEGRIYRVRQKLRDLRPAKWGQV